MVPYHILLLVHAFQVAKMALLSHTSCLQEAPTTLQLEAIFNIQVAFMKSTSHSATSMVYFCSVMIKSGSVMIKSVSVMIKSGSHMIILNQISVMLLSCTKL